ncbi:hypothetical protein Tco_0302771 [Tanacetum coccineum]
MNPPFFHLLMGPIDKCPCYKWQHQVTKTMGKFHFSGRWKTWQVLGKYFEKIFDDRYILQLLILQLVSSLLDVVPEVAWSSTLKAKEWHYLQPLLQSLPGGQASCSLCIGVQGP